MNFYSVGYTDTTQRCYSCEKTTHMVITQMRPLIGPLHEYYKYQKYKFCVDCFIGMRYGGDWVQVSSRYLEKLQRKHIRAGLT